MERMTASHWVRLVLGIGLVAAGMHIAGCWALAWCACVGWGMCIMKPGAVKEGITMAFAAVPLLLLPGIFIDLEWSTFISMAASPAAFLLAGVVGE